MVIADVIRRWEALKSGVPAEHLPLYTGTDEHGIKVFKASERAGVSPAVWCDSLAARYKKMADLLDIPVSRFIRTTDEDHKNLVQRIWNKLLEKGDIYLGRHCGWYSIADECFYADHEVHEIDGKMVTKESARPVEWIEEPNYMFKVTKYREKIKQWLQKSVVVPDSRLNDLLNYLEGEDSMDISVSRLFRSVKWGIKVPNDEEHAIYVWFDALTNYLTATTKSGEIPDSGPTIQVLGKDILKFHAIIWPAMLFALEVPIMPQRLIVHGHWTVDGVKMSKSLGNVLNPFDLAATVPTDSLRYCLVRDGRLDADCDISHSYIAKIHNQDLVNQLGNLLSRAFNSKFMIGAQQSSDLIVSATVKILADEVAFNFCSNMDGFRVHMAVENLQKLIFEANRLFSDKKPWILLKNASDHHELRCLLHDILYLVALYGILVEPIMPRLSRVLSDMFLPQKIHGSLQQRLELIHALSISTVPPGDGRHLFTRISV